MHVRVPGHTLGVWDLGLVDLDFNEASGFDLLVVQERKVFIVLGLRLRLQSNTVDSYVGSADSGSRKPGAVVSSDDDE